MIALLLVAQLTGTLPSCVDLTGSGWCQAQSRDYGSDDVGRAMAICDKHFMPDGPVISMYPEGGRPPRAYLSEWRSCYAVREAWLKSEAARRERELSEQEQRDLDFVKGVAEKQK